jgi:hypothetical protein
LIKAILGATWGQRFIWVQTGDPKHTYTESEKREGVTRVSTSLGHLSMSEPRVNTSLVHLTHVGPTHLTSGSHLCHVAVSQWSTSAAISPGKYKWPDLIGPHHKPHHHLSHMAICEWSTPARDMPNGSTA